MDSATDLTVDKVCSDFSLGQSDLGKYGKDLEIRMVTLIWRSGWDRKHESDQVTDLGLRVRITTFSGEDSLFKKKELLLCVSTNKGSIRIKRCHKKWKKSTFFLAPPPPPFPSKFWTFLNLGKI